MSQIQTKFIADSAITTAKINNSAVDANKLATDAVTGIKILADAVTGAKIRLDNNQFLRARNAANSADVNMLKVNASDEMETAVALNIAANIKPTTANSRSLGASSLEFADVFTRLIKNSTGSTVLDVESRALKFPNSTNAFQFTSNGVANITGQLYLQGTSAGLYLEDDAADTVGIEAPATISSSYVLVLPVDAGSSGQVLQTNGSGVTSWVTPATSSTAAKETFTLSAGDITNQYITLANTPNANSVLLIVKGGAPTLEGASHDYSVSGAQVNFLNDLATGGAAALVAGDILQVMYTY